MEFKDFLQYINEAESTAEKDDKAEKAGKKVAKDIEYDEGHKGRDDENAEEAGDKVTKDIEYDDKKDKKSLKDWFEMIDKNMLAEAEQVSIEPAKQNTQVLKKGNQVIGTVTNPALAANIKSAIGKGEMSLAGHEMKEEALDEKWAGDAEVKQTGEYAGKTVEELKSMLSKLKKSGPHKEGSPGFKKMRQIMFAIRAKKGWKGGVDEAAVEESGLQAYLGKKKYGPEGMKALQQAGRDGASKEKMTQIRAKYDKLGEVEMDEAINVLFPDPARPDVVRYPKGDSQQGDQHRALAAQKAKDARAAGRLKGSDRSTWGYSSRGGPEAERSWDPAKTNRPRPTPLGEKAKNPYAIGMAQAMKSTGDEPPLKKSTITKAHDIAKKIKKTDEAEIPKSGPDYGAGLGAGRNAKVLESGQLNEFDVSFDDVKDFYLAYHVIIDWGLPLALIAFLVAEQGIIKTVALIKQGKNAVLKKYKEMKKMNVTPDPEKIKQAAEKIKSAGKKKQKVKESMNTCEAAYHEGKAHGLTKHGYSCRYDEGSEEHSHYHRGFKEGLDECYGLMPNRGLVVSEVESGADVVDDMASYGAEEGDLAETSFEPKDQHFYKDMYDSDDEAEKMEGNAFTAALAKTDKGEKFTVGGKTFTDRSDYNAKIDEFAFESLDKQLNDLLNEGVSVNMSQGLGGPGAEDSVSVTAQGDDAGKLLQFIKQVGLGGLGAPEQVDGPSEPAVAVSDYGAPKFDGYDKEKGDMMGLLKVMSGDDYKDEEGHDHDMPKVKMCGTHGVDEAKCGCGEGKEMVDEVESEDQMEYQVAEDDGEGNIEADEQGAQIDAALAVGSENEKAVHEAGDGGEESSPEAAGAVAAADSDEEQEEAMSESSFLNLYKKLSWLAEESTAEKDDKAEKAAKKIAKDIEYDEGHKGKDDEKAEKAGEEVKKDIEYDDKKDKKEKVDEWANDAGKDGTQQTFERDIEFMTKVISGGLNKPKSTGQQTIPVLAGDKERTGDEDMAEYKKLAGLGQ